MKRELYFDRWIQHSSATHSQKIVAYYYNRAVEWNEKSWIAYKHDAFMFGTAICRYECTLANVQPFYWQTDTAAAAPGSTWKTMISRKPRAVICDLADGVSKNGNLSLANIGPKADGTISAKDTAVLLEIVVTLKTNGEAIYGTAWRTAPEGPTLVGRRT